MGGVRRKVLCGGKMGIERGSCVLLRGLKVVEYTNTNTTIKENNVMLFSRRVNYKERSMRAQFFYSEMYDNATCILLQHTCFIMTVERQ